MRKAGGEPGGVTVESVSEAAVEALGPELGGTVKLTAEQLAAALDPWAFVRSRTIPGGPAPETVRAHVAQMQATLARMPPGAQTAKPRSPPPQGAADPRRRPELESSTAEQR